MGGGGLTREQSAAAESETSIMGNDDNVAGPQIRTPRNPTNDVLVALATALMAAALVICFHSPSFIYWLGLDIIEARKLPHVNRAVDTLRQLDDPSVEITGRSNRVINWRLLFPILGHYLHFPPWLFLALPHIGCLLTLMYVALLALRETRSRWYAFLISMICGATPWFFVSTGWLTYFDSFLVLGLLIAAFSPSRLAIALACLAVPWIDERIVLAIPLCVVVRLAYVYQLESRHLRTWLAEVLLIGCLIVPYIAFRLAYSAGTDTGLASYIARVKLLMMEVPLHRFLEGLWSGYRAAWVFPVAFLVLTWSERRLVASLFVVTTTVGTTVLALILAEDLSRNLMMLIPAVVAGAFLLLRVHPEPARMALPILLGANFLIPTSHVITRFDVPIYSLKREVHNYKNPPQLLRADNHWNLAEKLFVQQEFIKALHFYDNAIKLDANMARAYIGRSKTQLALSQFEIAKEDIDEAIRLSPDNPESYYVRARLHLEAGERQATIEDLKTALEKSNAQWERRNRCERNLQILLESPDDFTPTSLTW